MDILIGYNSDEGLISPVNATPAEFIANVEKRYGPFTEKLLETYPAQFNLRVRTGRNRHCVKG